VSVVFNDDKVHSFPFLDNKFRRLFRASNEVVGSEILLSKLPIRSEKRGGGQYTILNSRDTPQNLFFIAGRKDFLIALFSVF
jgi:hypothetical protein